LGADVARTERPVLYLCGLEDLLSGAHAAAGHKLSIASRSPHTHQPEGKVEALVPWAEDLRAFRCHEITQEEFRGRYMRHIEALGVKLVPGKLLWHPYSFFKQDDTQPVEPGDVLYCLCLHAAKDGIECHRLWAAELLTAAGWRVVLDGKGFFGGGSDDHP
jgi:hypothetical protein